MTYEYAEKKLDELFNRALEEIDRIDQLISPDADWLDQTLWAARKERAVYEYLAAARTVIEIFIEFTEGDDRWRELHAIQWTRAEKLNIEIKASNKTD